MGRAAVTRVYKIDPLQDRRWAQFLERHHLATLFHSPEWLDALQRTYGYIIFTASWRLAVNAWINPGLAPWLSNFLFIWVAMYLWYRTVRELPLAPAAVRAAAARLKI